MMIFRSLRISTMLVSFILLLGIFILPLSACNEPEAPPAEVVDTAEVMPRYPGCEEADIPDDMAKYRCSIEMLMQHLGEELKYPPAARAKGTTGEAVVQFIVREDGKVEFVEILQDPGDGLGEEAARLVKNMTEKDIRWRPGYKDGKAVAVRFNLPVAFTLPRDPDTGKILEE